MEAVTRAAEQLKDVDIGARAALLDLNMPDEKTIAIRVFGSDMLLDTHDFTLTVPAEGREAKPADLLLVLHFLLSDFPVRTTGKLISFRDFKAGQFYYVPFQARTVKPLAGRIGNDIALLKKNLDRFDWEEAGEDYGDFTARIHSFGPMNLTLIYRLGDEEFPPEAEILFDSCVKDVFEAEDAAVLAGRICIGLL